MTPGQFLDYRHALDMTQELLAKRLRVDVQTVARYEKGQTAIPGAVEKIMEIMIALHREPQAGKIATAKRLREICEIEARR